MFQSGKIYQGDDYKILLLEDLDRGIILSKDKQGMVTSSDEIQRLLESAKSKVQLLDRVLLSNIYTLQDNNAAYDLSSRRINEKNEIQNKVRWK